jgi:hypothetical protein
VAIACVHLPVDELGHAELDGAWAILIGGNQPIDSGVDEGPFRRVEVIWAVVRATGARRLSLAWLERCDGAPEEGGRWHEAQRLPQEFASLAKVFIVVHILPPRNGARWATGPAGRLRTACRSTATDEEGASAFEVSLEPRAWGRDLADHADTPLRSTEARTGSGDLAGPPPRAAAGAAASSEASGITAALALPDRTKAAANHRAITIATVATM